MGRTGVELGNVRFVRVFNVCSGLLSVRFWQVCSGKIGGKLVNKFVCKLVGERCKSFTCGLNGETWCEQMWEKVGFLTWRCKSFTRVLHDGFSLFWQGFTQFPHNLLQLLLNNKEVLEIRK